MKQDPAVAAAHAGRVVSSHGRDAVVEDEAARRVHCRLQGRRLTAVCGDRVRWSHGGYRGRQRLDHRGPATIDRTRAHEPARRGRSDRRQPDPARFGRWRRCRLRISDSAIAISRRRNGPASRPASSPTRATCRMPQALLVRGARRLRGHRLPRAWASKREPGGEREIAQLLKDEISVLVGQSGVGKSSLINLLVPGVEATVQEISRAAESRAAHDDRPPRCITFRRVATWSTRRACAISRRRCRAARRSPAAFARSPAAAAGCRFKDCMHLREPGCAVAAAGECRQGSPRGAWRATASSSAQSEELSRRDAAVQAMSWRPASACASVPPSTYSSSPPTGTPCAMRDARIPRARHQLAEEVRGRLALDRRVGREDHLAHLALVEQRLELLDAELLGPDAVERRQVAHQHEVAAAVAARLLDRDDVGGRFDDAERRADRAAAPRRSRTTRLRSACGSAGSARRFAVASSSARASARPPSRLRSSRWKAMRCADFGPTPGRHAQRLDQSAPVPAE